MDQASQLRNIIKAQSISAPPLARVMTVTSGKGGVGKSSTAINLALQFRKLGQRVIILDADFGLANIEIMFGAVPKHNLSDLIYQNKNIREIITWGPMDVGFISGGSGIAGLSNLSREYLIYIIQNLAELDALADIIIIDTGAGISSAVLEFLVASGEVILVTTPEPTSITDSYSLLKALLRHPRYSEENTQVKMIANRVETIEEGETLYNKLNAVVSRYLKLELHYIGAIPTDPQLSQAVIQQVPVTIHAPACKAALALENIAARLQGLEETQTVTKRGMAAFFSHILRTRKDINYAD
ncbi:MAG: MinD/ParA family protein [Lachnospiraceae bacterium]|jgi:flagellar biosynthesis protein FlhG|nr:MinD/ParA family protein [Lachnospiraceae bacterium]